MTWRTLDSHEDIPPGTPTARINITPEVFARIKEIKAYAAEHVLDWDETAGSLKNATPEEAEKKTLFLDPIRVGFCQTTQVVAGQRTVRETLSVAIDPNLGAPVPDAIVHLFVQLFNVRPQHVLVPDGSPHVVVVVNERDVNG